MPFLSDGKGSQTCSYEFHLSLKFFKNTYVCVCKYIHMTVCGCMHIEHISNFDIILIFILAFNTVPLHIPTNDQCTLRSRQFCIQFIFQIFDVLNNTYLKDHISFHYLSD